MSWNALGQLCIIFVKNCVILLQIRTVGWSSYSRKSYRTANTREKLFERQFSAIQTANTILHTAIISAKFESTVSFRQLSSFFFVWIVCTPYISIQSADIASMFQNRAGGSWKVHRLAEAVYKWPKVSPKRSKSPPRSAFVLSSRRISISISVPTSSSLHFSINSHFAAPAQTYSHNYSWPTKTFISSVYKVKVVLQQDSK